MFPTTKALTRNTLILSVHNEEVKDGNMERAELFRKKLEEMGNESQEFSGMFRYQCFSI